MTELILILAAIAVLVWFIRPILEVLGLLLSILLPILLIVGGLIVIVVGMAYQDHPYFFPIQWGTIAVMALVAWRLERKQKDV